MGAFRRTIVAFMAMNIARKRDGVASELRPLEAAPDGPTCCEKPLAAGFRARRARLLPSGSSQLVITGHLLTARMLEPHRDLTLEGVPVEVSVHRGRLRLAMTFDDHVVLGQASLLE